MPGWPAPPRPPRALPAAKACRSAELQVREIDGGSYVVAVVRQAGRPAPDVLLEALPGLLASLRFDKSMRWNSSNVAFSRPIRWLLALFGDQLVPFAYAGLHRRQVDARFALREPGRISPSAALPITSALMESQGILLDGDQRRGQHPGADRSRGCKSRRAGRPG